MLKFWSPDGVIAYTLIVAVIIVWAGAGWYELQRIRSDDTSSKPYGWIRTIRFILCLVWVLEYIYVLFAKIGWLPAADPVWYGGVFVRPLAMLTGLTWLVEGMLGAPRRGRKP